MLVHGKCECFIMQLLYVCVHPVVFLNTAFCMTCSLVMLVEDARGDHMEETYSRASLITAFLIAMNVSFCLPHLFACADCTT